MNKDQVLNYLSKNLKFNSSEIKKIDIFQKELIKFNANYNLIGTSTLNDIWLRHILDSAQIVKFIDFNKDNSLSDLGTGAGLPGLILAIYAQKFDFHVKLYEKSKVKCIFLDQILSILKLNRVSVICSNINNEQIDTNYVTCRAFRKLDYIISISRENVKVNHKLIILKGKNALEEINMLQMKEQYRYEVKDSITDKESKILIFDVKKK
jgi:16S rRNA (guanine527-N7)-methyltransferase